MNRVIGKPIVKSCVIFIFRFSYQFFCTVGKRREYVNGYKVLGVPYNSDEETVRKAFIELCKKYHPDSKNQSADAIKFQEIESAYRLLQKKFANEGIGEYGLYHEEKRKSSQNSESEIFDIKHTAPQHRQYLSFDGVGSGTPSQRQKQYVMYKTVIAAENVHDHHIKKLTAAEGNSLVCKDKAEAKKLKTRYGMDRLVEDLIQESMARGHFDNLKGQGKPLPPSTYNPFVDFTTHKMNQIMIDNGFVPEWINLQKEIMTDISNIQEILVSERQKLGSYPFSYSDEKKWDEVIDNLKNKVEKLNKKIDKYNLLVPIMNKQKIHFNLKKESSKILDIQFSPVKKCSKSK